MARTLAQINAEIEKLKKQAQELKSREVREVVARIKQAIKHYGLTPRDLFGKAGAAGAPAGRGKAKTSANAAPRRTKSKAAGVIRFRDEAGNGWVGRRKRPNWFKAALAAGKTLQDFAI